MSQQINLLHPGLRKARELLTAVSLATVSALLFAAVLVTYVWAHADADGKARLAAEQTAALKAAQEELLAVTKTLAERASNDKLAAELAASQALLRARQEIFAYLDRGTLGNTDGFAQFLQSLARQTPGGLWLTGFTIEGGGREMEIHGRMLQAAALPEYIRRLNAEPAFKGRSFASLDIHQPAVDKTKPSVAGVQEKPSYVEFALMPSATPAPVANAPKAAAGVGSAAAEMPQPAAARPAGTAKP